MFRVERGVIPQASRSGAKSRRSPAAVVGAIALLLILVSSAAFLVACGDDPDPTPVPTATAAPAPADTPVPEPTSVPTPEPTPEPAVLDDDALTRAFVAAAIEYYGENGLDATVEFYRSESGTENGRTLILIDQAESRLLVYRNIPALEGQNVGPGSPFTGLTQLVGAATEEGLWITTRGV
ncbi:MAG: hypothetical protein OXS35_04590, partial [Dehalococcoidia bacterium]|nr:hypothetical protein [Dehalococcoidia bacterium]